MPDIFSNPFLVPTDRADTISARPAATSAAWHWRRVYELSKEEAVRRIRLIDAEREAFFRRYLNEDVSNPDLYDLVLNQARLSMDSIVDIVVLGMESRGLVKIDAEPELSRAHA